MSYQQPIIKMLFNEAGSKVSLDLNAEISLQTLDLHGKTSRIDLLTVAAQKCWELPFSTLSTLHSPTVLREDMGDNLPKTGGSLPAGVGGYLHDAWTEVHVSHSGTRKGPTQSYRLPHPSSEQRRDQSLFYVLSLCPFFRMDIAWFAKKGSKRTERNGISG